MPRNNIELYWQKAETATEGVTAQVLVTDGNSSDYLLPYPCTLTAEGWVKTASDPGGATNLLEAVRGNSSETKICEATPPEGDRRTGFPDPGPTTGR